MSNIYYYALTLRKTRGPVSQNDYDKYMLCLQRKFATLTVIEGHYEMTRGLHYHAMISSRYRIRPSSIRLEKNGWSWQLNDVTHYDGWMTYIRKDTKRELVNHFLATESDVIPKNLDDGGRKAYAMDILHIEDTDSLDEETNNAWYYKTRLV